MLFAILVPKHYTVFGIPGRVEQRLLLSALQENSRFEPPAQHDWKLAVGVSVCGCSSFCVDLISNLPLSSISVRCTNRQCLYIN